METTNSQKLGSFVADAMERLESLEEETPDYKLGDIMLICEIQKPSQGITSTRIISTDPRGIIQMGLLRSATLAVEER